MSKKVVWSPLSENDFAKILEYLDKKWNNKVTNHFIDLTESMIEQISINPRQFPVINKKEKIRKCVLTKHNTMFYQIVNPRLIYLEFMTPGKIQIP